MSDSQSSFFYGTAVAPEVNSTDALLDELESQVATVTAANTQAQQASSDAIAAANNAAISEANVATLSQEANDTLSQANTALAAANAAVTSAQGSATAAAGSASAASASASAASSSQTAAASSATTASTAATNAGASQTAAASSASSASTSASSASTSASNASASATSAATQATNSSNSAISASGSATTATTQAGIATTQASNASTSATNASGYAANALTSQNAAAASASLAASFTPSLAGKNVLLNPRFVINQRAYTSGAATTIANQYTLDRWRVVTLGQNVSFTSSGNGNQITAPAGGIEQVVEAINVAGGTYTLSWTGTATATINGTSISKGGQVTLPANTNATVRFIGGTCSLPQLEAGSVASPVEFRFFQHELDMCQRYYIPQGATVIYSARVTSGDSYFISTQFIKRMRGAPTIVATQSGGTASFPSTNPTSIVGSAFGFSCTLPAASGTGVGTYGFVYTADAEL